VPHGTLTIYDMNRFLAIDLKSATDEFLCPALMPEPKSAPDDGDGAGEGTQ